MNELTIAEWRRIKDYPDYEVSNFGKVKSFKSDEPLILKSGTSRGGHQSVALNGKTYQVHHLVITEFVGPRPKGMECCHNDGNPANNHISNLRWDTHKSNMRDAINHGAIKTGVDSPFSKVSTEQKERIKRLKELGIMQKTIASMFGLSGGTISRVINEHKIKSEVVRAILETLPTEVK